MPVRSNVDGVAVPPSRVAVDVEPLGYRPQPIFPRAHPVGCRPSGSTRVFKAGLGDGVAVTWWYGKRSPLGHLPWTRKFVTEPVIRRRPVREFLSDPRGPLTVRCLPEKEIRCDHD